MLNSALLAASVGDRLDRAGATEIDEGALLALPKLNLPNDAEILCETVLAVGPRLPRPAALRGAPVVLAR